MWRKTGEGIGVFAALSALTFILICAGLVGLFVFFIMPSERAGIRLLITLTLVIGGAGFLLLFFQFTYHLLTRRSGRLDRLEQARLEAWLGYAYGERSEPPRDAISAAALARLRDTTVGSFSDDLARLYRLHGFLQRDLQLLSSRRREQRSRALARLGQIRDASAIPVLQELLSSGPARIGPETLRVLARCLDVPQVNPKMARREFTAACASRLFTEGEIESSLVLTGRHSAALVRHLLHINLAPVAALTVMGHKNLLELVPLLPNYLSSPEPEIRAAALRAVAKLELAPEGSEPDILASLEAVQSFVRAQAAKATITVPLAEAEGPLVRALGDRDWWVRQNAAASLAAFGEAGASVLAEVALTNSDPFAREAARRAVN